MKEIEIPKNLLQLGKKQNEENGKISGEKFMYQWREFWEYTIFREFQFD